MALFKKHISKLSDNELTNEYKKHYAQKYTSELYARYAHLVMGVSLKYLKNIPEAKDNTQDVYAILTDKLKTHDIANFSSWLYQLTKNECLMKLRRNKRIELVPFNSQENEPQEESFLEEKLIKEVQLTAVIAEIEHLKPEQSLCIKLFYLEKMSYKDVAHKTNFSEKEVKSYIQNGKRNLKNQLIEHAEFRTEKRAPRTA